MLLEPSLFLGLFGLRRRRVALVEKVRHAVVVLDVPPILRHGDNETTHNKNGENGRVLAWNNGEIMSLRTNRAPEDRVKHHVPFLDLVSLADL